MNVGVIGLGSMGMGAALNLLHKGHKVTGCELREDLRAAFAAEGGKVVDSTAATDRSLGGANLMQTSPGWFDGLVWPRALREPLCCRSW